MRGGLKLFLRFYAAPGLLLISIILKLGATATAHGAATLVAHAGQSVTGPALPSLAVADE